MLWAATAWFVVKPSWKHILEYFSQCNNHMCECSVLKVGVACMDDARYLFYDYNLVCVGCIDLRHLIPCTLPASASNMCVYMLINSL